MGTTEKLKTRIDRLSIRKRLTYSNILMFLIPVAVTGHGWDYGFYVCHCGMGFQTRVSAPYETVGGDGRAV